MIVCPFCRAEVPDDSRFCDQCGKEFMFCPECCKPKRGTMCAACGADLVTADVFFGTAKGGGACLRGDGLELPLGEGVFGRNGGIWPALGAYQYISGVHGRIGRDGQGWTITDLGSTNGTKVNGVAIAKDIACPIRRGDKIMIATSEFTVE